MNEKGTVSGMFSSKYQREDLLELLELLEEVGEAPCTSYPDAYFPANKDLFQATSDTRWAKEACRRCPIVDECLAYAIKWEPDFGIWGGTLPNERVRLARRKA